MKYRKKPIIIDAEQFLLDEVPEGVVVRVGSYYLGLSNWIITDVTG